MWNAAAEGRLALVTLDQMNPRLIVVLVVLGAVCLAAGLFGALRSGDGGAEEAAAEVQGARLPPGVRAPDFDLRDQDGRRVSMRSLRGRPVLVTFLYTHCDETCPAQAQQIKGALDDLGHDVPAIAISVEPERDTPATARHFLAKQGMTGRMKFVLGTRAQLAPVWKGYAITPQRRRAEHMSRIVLVDAAGMQRIGFPGEQATPDRLANDIGLLERVGQPG